LRLAYLCARYPGISNTFILREVLALRELGVEVDTFAIRRTDPADLLAEVDRAEFETTYAVLPARPSTLVRSHLAAFGRDPAHYLATLLLALRLAPPGARGLLWQLFYVVEAMVVWRECERRGLRHLHAQFANVSTDVALLVAHFGGGEWSWSLSVHGPVEFYDVTLNRLGEKIRRARFVICISDFARSQLLGLAGEEHWPKVHVIHCGVDVEAFSPPDRERREEGPLRVLTVGRQVQIKGQAMLLYALADLRERGLDVEVTMIGQGPKHDDLRRIAAELGVSGHVTLTGAIGQDEIRDYYRRADVFCLPSFAEGVPVVLMEAMAMELPVIATRIMGVPELVDHGVSGLVVPPAREDLLADAIEALVRDPERRREMGLAGRMKVAEEFNLRTEAERLRDVYRAELAAADRPAVAAGVP
jgi:colanic acid/amylovoran biosynthesis glycosyltransferase